jgi:hypothetical protein
MPPTKIANANTTCLPYTCREINIDPQPYICPILLLLLKIEISQTI